MNHKQREAELLAGRQLPDKSYVEPVLPDHAPRPELLAAVATARRLRELGFGHVIVAYWFPLNPSADEVALLKDAGVKAALDLQYPTPAQPAGWEAWGVKDFIAAWQMAGADWGCPRQVDAVINLDLLNYEQLFHFLGTHSIMRPWLERNPVAVVPFDPARIVQGEARVLTPAEAVGASEIGALIHANNLKGHYCEFGTWIGRSFYSHYRMFSSLLEGNFYAFDSFGGLSKPLPVEVLNTGGDFDEGRYWCNLASFKAIGALLGYTDKRFSHVPGFYDKSIRGKSGQAFGIAARSVSVAYVDCDIYEPSKDVLNLLTDLLEDGAFVCFDDYYLNRASPNSGERRAMREWLATNPTFELLPYTRTSSQNQWFIFNRI